MKNKVGQENKFVRTVVKHLKAKPVRVNGGIIRASVTTEFAIPGCGIADLVISDTSGAGHRKLKRKLLQRIAGSQSFAAFFALVEEPWVKNRMLVANRMGVSPKTAGSYIRFLSDYHRQTLLMHRRALISLELWTIEAKIHDWKRAVRQASKHTLYSTGSIVLMPSERVRPALTHTRALRNLGIGLWSYSQGEKMLTKHCAPRKRRPSNTAPQLQSAARFWLRNFKRSIA